MSVAVVAPTSWLAAVSSSSKADTLSSDTRSLSLTWKPTDTYHHLPENLLCDVLNMQLSVHLGSHLHSSLGNQGLTRQGKALLLCTSSFPPLAPQEHLVVVSEQCYEVFRAFKAPVAERRFPSYVPLFFCFTITAVAQQGARSQRRLILD